MVQKIDIREGNVTDVTIGAGGAAVCGSVNGNKGNDSVLATVNCHRVVVYGGNHSTAGGPGGSGGGGSGTGGPGPGTPGQGK